MKKALWISAAALGGVALFALGLLVPAQFRATDASVLRRVAQGTPSLVQEGIALAGAGHVEQARLLLEAAQKVQAPGAAALEQAVRASALKLPAADSSALTLQMILTNDSRLGRVESRPAMELLLKREARQTALTFLSGSPRSGVRDLLRTRELTNLVHFSPAGSASGQPFEAATFLAALLLDHLNRPLRDAIESAAFAAVRRGEVQPLELIYLDLLALGKRLTWPQLTHLLKNVASLDALRDLANLARSHEAEWPSVYAAAHFTQAPGEVARYVIRFGEAGFADLRFSLWAGQGAVRRLVQEQRPVHHASYREKVVAYDPFYSAFAASLNLSVASPALALGLKYVAFAVSAFLLASVGCGLLALGTQSGQKDAPGLQLGQTPKVILMACFLMVAAALSEPLRTQPGRQLDFPLRWKFPMIGGDARAKSDKTMKPMVDSFSVAALAFFLAVQVGIYIFCRRKLAEIQRQPLPDKLKLKLLDNEENLFDAGLYCGFVGTVLSLVCVSIGIIKPSLMAAYSSTSFGIIFVSILKIFYLRPYRRKLIIETEAQPA